MARVFLSYDRDDHDWARRLAPALEKAGHSVWWDPHVPGGAQFSKVIEEALKASDVVVVLWSANSLESPWVRDEAAAGRDTNRLVPATIDGTEPSLGFRQFQTVDLSNWKGRATSVALRTLLADVDAMLSTNAGETRSESKSKRVMHRFRESPRLAKWLVIGSLGFGLLIMALGLVIVRPWERKSRSVPTVAVTTSNGTRLSQELARDLLVKLGALQGPRTNVVELLDEHSSGSREDLRFTVSAAIQQGHPEASVTLLSNREGAMLWSKDFDQPGITRSDLEEQIAFSAARVLGCAIEAGSGETRQLSRTNRRVYLNACATLAEIGWDSRPVTAMLRQVLRDEPKFRPAWARLLAAEIDIVALLRSGNEPVAAEIAQLRTALSARARSTGTWRKSPLPSCRSCSSGT